jgi:hypothetical protein
VIPARLKGSPLEVLLAFQMDAMKWVYESQVKLIPGRKFTFDFVFRPQRLTVEVQGGVWARGNSGHTSGKGITRDATKANLAALEGYRCLFFTGDMIKSGEAVETLRRALG